MTVMIVSGKETEASIATPNRISKILLTAILRYSV